MRYYEFHWQMALFHCSDVRRDLRHFPKLEEVMAESEMQSEKISIYHARLPSL